MADMSAQVEIGLLQKLLQKNVYMQVQSDKCKDAGGDQLVQGHLQSSRVVSKFSLSGGRAALIDVRETQPSGTKCRW